MNEIKQHEETELTSENSDAGGQNTTPQKHVVFLIHGIRTQAEWATRAADTLNSNPSITVVRPIKYEFFDSIRFLIPGQVFRQKPINRIKKYIQQEISGGTTKLSVIAHSFGTYIIGRILYQEPHIRLHRLILCGGILPDDFDWYRICNNQLNKDSEDWYVVNDCGMKDKWPVIAKFVTFGYGSSGRFGFGNPQVKDRYFDVGHSGFFKEEFVKKNWLPYLVGEKINEGVLDRPPTPWWLNILTILKLPYIILVMFVLSGLLAVWEFPQYQNCIQNSTWIQCLKDHDLFARVTSAPKLQATVVEDGQGQVRLTWEAGSDNGSEVLMWQYRQKVHNGEEWFDWTDISDSNSEIDKYEVSDLTPGIKYEFQLRAVNRVGNGNASNGVSATPVGVPDAPTQLKAIDDKDGKVRLEWQAGSDNGSKVEKWQFLQITDGEIRDSGWTDIPDSNSGTNKYEVSDLTLGKKYEFQMRAVNRVGDGEVSDEIYLIPIGGPDAPTQLKAKVVQDGQVRLEWQAGSDNGSEVKVWQILQKEDGEKDVSDWTDIPNSGPDTKSHEVSRLTFGKKYTFRVRAVNDAGQGGFDKSTIVAIWPVQVRITYKYEKELQVSGSHPRVSRRHSYRVGYKAPAGIEIDPNFFRIISWRPHSECQDRNTGYNIEREDSQEIRVFVYGKEEGGLFKDCGTKLTIAFRTIEELTTKWQSYDISHPLSYPDGADFVRLDLKLGIGSELTFTEENNHHGSLKLEIDKEASTFNVLLNNSN